MKFSREKIGVTFIALCVLGCKSVQPTTASANADHDAVIGSSSAGNAANSQIGYITDPSMDNMRAISVTFPAKWNFQSIFLQGGTCAPTPFGVFRATSPDGQSMVERMPALAWQWGKGPMIGYMAKTDCLPVQNPMSAEEFLRYMADTMSVQYVGPAPVPAAEEAKAQKDMSDSQAAYAPKYAALHLQQPRQQRQLARATVNFKKGDIAMKGFSTLSSIALRLPTPAHLD
jgi:hypothetical protein